MLRRLARIGCELTNICLSGHFELFLAKTMEVSVRPQPSELGLKQWGVHALHVVVPSDNFGRLIVLWGKFVKFLGWCHRSWRAHQWNNTAGGREGAEQDRSHARWDESLNRAGTRINRQQHPQHRKFRVYQVRERVNMGEWDVQRFLVRKYISAYSFSG